MEDIDKNYELSEDFNDAEEEEHQLLMKEVVQGDHTLLYLDTYLRELFS